MNTDLMLVAGILLAVLSVPALTSAFSEGRPPRLAAVLIVIAGTLLLIAVKSKPSGYSFTEVLAAFGRVFWRFQF
jgi:hypothetical protein